MRNTIRRKYSTKAERIFYEILKKNRIPFRFREMVDGREIDFIVRNYAIEIDGHPQSSKRNAWLFARGFTPLHYTNDILYNQRDKVEEIIKNKLLWQQKRTFRQ